MSKNINLTPELLQFMDPLHLTSVHSSDDLFQAASEAAFFWVEHGKENNLSMSEIVLPFGLDGDKLDSKTAAPAIAAVWVIHYLHAKLEEDEVLQ